MILSYFLSFLFSKLGNYKGEFDIYSSIVLYLASFCKITKLDIKTKTGLICRHCKSIISSNGVIFIGSGVRNMEVNLSIAESIVKAKKTDNLFYFVCEDGRRNEVLLGITDLSKREIFSTIFLLCLSL